MVGIYRCEMSVMQRVAVARRHELETEEHMRTMGVQQKDRLIRDITRLNKELQETRDRSSIYEVYTSTSHRRNFCRGT